VLYAFFWVIPRRLNFMCRNTLFHLHRQVGMKYILHTYLPVMEQTVCSEMSAHKIQTPGNYPEESLQNSQVAFLVVRFCLNPNFSSNNMLLLFKCPSSLLYITFQRLLKMKSVDILGCSWKYSFSPLFI